jgi:hypothetical protein
LSKAMHIYLTQLILQKTRLRQAQADITII